MSGETYYARRLKKTRDRERAKDQFTGGYILCDCSWVPQFSIKALKIFRRRSKKRSEILSTFASCDRCGQVKRLYGDGWTHGTPPAFAMTENQIRIIMRAVEEFKQSAKSQGIFGGQSHV